MRLGRQMVVGLASILVGCVTLEVDREPVCVGTSTEGLPLRIADGDALDLFFSVSRGGCSRLEAPSCSAEVDTEGNVIEVHTEYLLVDRLERSCTYDLDFEVVDCTTGPLPAGDYTLRYAGSERALSVPYDAPSFCMRGVD